MRRAIVATLAGLLLCTPAPRATKLQPLPAQTVRIVLPPSQEHHRRRVARAAAESLTQYRLWLGVALPEPTIRSTATAETPVAADEVAVSLPWHAAAATMEVESAVAYALALRYWPHETSAGPLVRGLAAYLQGRIVERLFNVVYAQPGHSSEGVRFFGGAVPWSFRSLRVSRWGDAMRRGREAAAFAMLERYLSWPVMQGGLRALAEQARRAPLTRERSAQVFGAAAGQDLGWFFDLAFASDATVDYAIGGIESIAGDATCGGRSCFRTRVTVARRGEAAFTGSARRPVGPYEAGEGIVVQVTFADGQQVTASWDGRAAERTFAFESPTPAVSARLDPGGLLLLDPTRSDHERRVAPETNVPLAKWAARWLVWVQDAMLSYAMLL